MINASSATILGKSCKSSSAFAEAHNRQGANLMTAQAKEAQTVQKSEHISLRHVEMLQQELDQVRRAVLQTELPKEVKRPSSSASEAKQASVAKVLKIRRERSALFGPGLFGEPAWDMLLELYLAELRYVRMSISGLCRLIDVPSTTALRWIAKLESAELVVKQGDPRDARKSWLKLTELGFARLDSVIAKMQDA